MRQSSSVAEHHSLTNRQLMMWTGQQLSPGVPFANMVLTFRVSGELDEARFCGAFERLLAETDALRTVFRGDGELPEQQVLPSIEFALPVVDLSRSDDPERALGALVDERGAAALPLSERCFDSALVRLGPSEYVWFLCQHHTITDGLSCAVLFHRLAARYASPQADGAQELHEFRPYIELERRYRESPAGERDAAYWQGRLRSIDPLTFYGEPSSRPQQGKAVERVRVSLCGERMEGLRATARRREVAVLNEDFTINAVFQTLLFAFQARICGAEHPSVGGFLHNRPSRGLADVAGCFIEVCPFQVDTRADDSFLSLLGRVQKAVMRDTAHGRHSIANPTTSKYYDVLLNFHKGRFGDFCGMPTRADFTTGMNHLPAASASDFQGTEALLLQVQDFDGAGAYTLDFDFDSARFDADQRERAVEHFMRLFDALVSDPEARIADVDLLSSGERQRVLGFNPALEPDPDPSTVVERIAGQALARPDAPAVITGETTLSYRELDQRSNRLAHELVARGVGPGDLVAVCMERSQELVVAMLAIMKAGAAYVPLDVSHPAARIGLVIDDAKPRLMLTSSEHAARLQRDECLSLDALSSEIAQRRDSQPDVVLRARDVAYVIFTSGSTGRPKGVRLGHRGLSNFLTAMAQRPGVFAGERVLSLTTVTFDISVLEIWLPLSVGAATCIVDGESVADPERLAGLIERFEVDVMQATPVTWRMLLDSDWSGRPKLRALCGGEAMPRDLAQALLSRTESLWNMYGPTETTVWSSVEKIDDLADEQGVLSGPITIGRPIRNNTFYVLDAQRRPVPIGVAGELWIGGDGLAHGYHERPDLSEAAFVANPFLERGPALDEPARMYRTGDLGRFLADGRLQCLGRVDQQIKLRGFRIEPGEIESALRELDAIDQAAVVLYQRGSDARLVAYVVPRDDGELDNGQLREHVRARVPDYMVPGVYVRLASLPLTTSGKVDRKALPDPDLALDSTAGDFVPPRNPIERGMVAIWQEILGASRIGIHDHFLDIGGNSLLLVRLFALVQRTYDVHLPLATILEAPTPAALSELIAQKQADGSGDASSAAADFSTVVAMRRGGKRPRVFCCAGAGGNVINLWPLAGRLSGEQPFYGLQARGVVDGDRPHESVVELARETIEDIREHQPHGPYYLAGYSAGGIVAFEIAQQLHAAGEEVPLLALIDSVCPVQVYRSRGERVQIHLQRVVSQGPGYLGRKALERAELARRRVRDRVRSVLGKRFPERFPYEKLAFSLRDAIERYQPRRYPGRIVMLRPPLDADDEFTHFVTQPAHGWELFSEQEIQIEFVDGGHLTLLDEEFVGTLASALQRVLDGAYGAEAKASVSQEQSSDGARLSG